MVLSKKDYLPLNQASFKLRKNYERDIFLWTFGLFLQNLWQPKSNADYYTASELADYVRLWSFSDSMHILVQ